MDTPVAKPTKVRGQKILKYSLFGILGVLVIGVGIFVWWGLTPLGPSDEALAALKGNDAVAVSEKDSSWVFTPKQTTPTAGYIFYPGGHVDARSYAVYASDIAKQGYLVVIPEMPLSLAVFGIDRATGILNTYASIHRWVIGGHSLGGVMASSYAVKNSSKLTGLVLLAAYPANGTDLSHTNLQVASLVGTLDTVINHGALESAKPLLPATTSYITLEGGNHGQFGSYGHQPGDTVSPTMSADEQRAQAVTATVAVLKGSATR